VLFENWFRVDARPFKQSLVNTIRYWSLMFKQHLIDHITHRSLISLSLSLSTHWYRFSGVVVTPIAAKWRHYRYRNVNVQSIILDDNTSIVMTPHFLKHHSPSLCRSDQDVAVNVERICERKPRRIIRIFDILN